MYEVKCNSASSKIYFNHKSLALLNEENFSSVQEQGKHHQKVCISKLQMGMITKDKQTGKLFIHIYVMPYRQRRRDQNFIFYIFSQIYWNDRSENRIESNWINNHSQRRLRCARSTFSFGRKWVMIGMWCVFIARVHVCVCVCAWKNTEKNTSANQAIFESFVAKLEWWFISFWYAH